MDFNNEPKKIRKSITWNEEEIARQMEERLANPKRKIDEPKTPYNEAEDPDDEYLTKLNEVNKTKMTVMQ